ncbi:hypothetical protein L2E82_13466 [Cichorium intybus]|uniref:Uncharacterized protein n=1 Tax=Cichorium intybus TaxID=13427 RepID=A0ACB9EX59_CICIN|nr:hypothetical protein L2E82_13466 [Cichorium intybus]
MDRAIERQRLLLEHLRPSSTSSSLENLDSSISVSLSSHRPGQKILENIIGFNFLRSSSLRNAGGTCYRSPPYRPIPSTPPVPRVFNFILLTPTQDQRTQITKFNTRSVNRRRRYFQRWLKDLNSQSFVVGVTAPKLFVLSIPSSLSHAKRANCYSQLELHKHLINDCDKALKLDPTLLQAYILKVHAAFRISKLNAYCGAIGTKHPMNLGGYGVELALMNMEYKAMDDSEIKKGVTLKDRHTEDLRQEVRGFIFSKILRYNLLQN